MVLRVWADPADKYHDGLRLMTHRLLLADDSVTIQRVIELTFADEDIEVTAVGDGQLAIDRLETNPPDIVLADVDMPKRDGYEVAAYVKSRPKLAHIPVVLLTGAFEPIDHARAAAAGSTDVLAKPFEPQMVINRVKELLGRKRQDEPEQYERPLEPPPLSPLKAQAHMENPTPSGEGVQQPVSLDDYFDQLDAAFANIQPGTAPAEETEDTDWAAFAPLAKSVPEVPPPPVPAMPAIDLSWAMATEPQVPYSPKESTPLAWPPAASAVEIAPAPPLPPITVSTVTHISPAAVAPPAEAAPVPAAPVTPVAPATPTPAAVAPPSVAQPPPAPRTNPFANLSAAKAEAAARAAAPVITDEIIEEVVARVLQRLSDKVVRETVTDIVTQTAERLVQEEIDRIRESGQ